MPPAALPGRAAHVQYLNAAAGEIRRQPYRANPVGVNRAPMRRCTEIRRAANFFQQEMDHIDDGEQIPAPTAARPGEYPVTLPADMAAKTAFAPAFRNSGLSRSALAERLGMDEKTVRRMIDPRHGTAPGRIDKALHALGSELVIEIRACSPLLGRS